jgi:type IV pilus assembly protein PilW
MNLPSKQYGFSKHHCRGFSLVELMVALVITLLLIAGISQVFLSTKKSFIVQETLARVQENGRFVIDMLSQDLRRAGHMGGIGGDPIGGTLNEVSDNGTCPTGDNTWGRMLDRRIFGLDDTNVSYVTGTKYACIPDSSFLRGDILVVRYQAPWEIGGLTSPTYKDNRLYLRTSLTQAKLFRGIDRANPANALSVTTGGTSEVVARAYYVGPSNTGSCDGKAVPALYRESLNDTGIPFAQEVAYGVENFQIRYGVDTDGDNSVDQYLDSGDTGLNDPDEWNSVIAAQVWVLVRSECPESGYDTTGTTYAMGDVTYDPDDTAKRGYRRQLYQTTVNLRNGRRL